jgi:serine/threonine-protein kinase
MSKPDVSVLPGLSEPTVAYRPPAEARPSRCRVLGAWATGSVFHGAIGGLLLHRLRMVTLLTLVPSLLILCRNLIEFYSDRTPLRQANLILHAGMTVVLAVLAALTWASSCWSLRALRAMELVLFGSMASFFGWMQYHLFFQPSVSEVCPVGQVEALRLVVAGTSVRWFCLIVIYGVFIPNTGRRCALATGGVAVLALVLTAAGAAAAGRLVTELLYPLFDLTVLLAVAVAVAVFGSYRLRALQEQAFEAQQLGQYRLKERLGAGGMGEVYLAEHVLLRRPCAIKLIRPGLPGADAVSLQRFEREVQTMATLTHPNTVEVFDYGHADDGTFYYVMEYLPGLNLEALVARHGALPPERVIHFLRQVCGALREAHGIGLLHRDIKPSNIIACERGRVPDVAKLLDFGLVQETGLPREAARLTVQGTILGSPPYMSPEQAAGRTDLDARSDIYSLGGVAYYLLTGQPPFSRETAMQMLLAHAYEPVVPPGRLRPGLPADLQEVVLRCLAKRPEERFGSAEALEKALAACRDAGRWTEERAGAWWRGVVGQEETVAHVALGVPTPA